MDLKKNERSDGAEMNDIIKMFNEDNTKFAKDAVVEARKNKGKINDYLLEHINEFSKNLEKYKDKECPISIIYSIYILAEFKEKRLFPILVKIFGNEQYNLNEIIGYCVTDKLNSILISVFNGDFELINVIVENKKIDDYIRSQFLRCYIYFYDNNMIDNKALEDYLLKVIKLYKYEEDSIYDAILEVIINTHLFNMIEEVKKMFHYEVIDIMIRGDYDDFIDDIFDYDDTLDKFSKIEDVIDEMSWWYCFSKKDDDFDKEKMQKLFGDFIEKDLRKLNTTGNTKIGRNDLCPCGSGKKYKKCCLDKKEITLPYQNFIDKSLSQYPKKKDNENKYDLYDFYKEEYIEIDKLIYKVLKHKQIPIYIKRDYNSENKINLECYKEAFKKIKCVVGKEKFNTIDEYDNKVSIHYSLYQFFEKYSELLIELLNESFCSNKSQYISNLKELSDFFYSNFDLNNNNEIIFLNIKYSLYNLENKLDDGINFFENKLKKCLPSLKYNIYNYLFDLYMCKYDDISKIEKLIEQEKDKNLQRALEELKLEFLNF